MEDRINPNEQARQGLIQHILDNIDPNLNYRDFYLRAFHELASMGLTLRKDVKGFFQAPEWQEPGHQKELMEQIKVYLRRYIR